ncbi:LuxR family transcriptional regulator [Burkholderia glumae]|nr:helix-turn-helix transcriptional regulator [Burkholderia glumae]PJO21414.1 LuxR family transcriptional regulator [Burkholderia glumae AU6208]NVE25528.1 helix-turn-helix transcriptional regulator [Burkholderia glumae]PNL05398.1 LuxR family transcriptional regulator [Burkholderia glumae]QGA41395.1 DNA-binding response regulator [Burkholderia glumae]
MAPPVAEVLSTRECEVLRWAAEGKTAYEIGIILGLTERTINFHISRSIIKLNASNRTNAVVKAVLMGLIVFA